MRQTHPSGHETVDYEEAVSLLAVSQREEDGQEVRTVHTMLEGRGAPFMLFGADWAEAKVLELLREADQRDDPAQRIQVCGPAASAMGHGIAVLRPEAEGGNVFIATRPEAGP